MLLFFAHSCLVAFLQSKPEIRDMSTTTDEHSITATFTVYNKPVNAFWALFQVSGRGRWHWVQGSRACNLLGLRSPAVPRWQHTLAT